MKNIIDIIKESPNRYFPDKPHLELSFINNTLQYPMYELIGKLLKPKSFLEIGTLLGWSTMAVMHGCQTIERVVAIDNETYVKNSNTLARKNIEKYITDYYRAGDFEWTSYRSIEEFNNTINENKYFDLMHIDGDHSYEGTMIDLEFALKINPRWLIIDDITHDEKEAVHGAVKIWAKKHGIYYFVIDSYGGTACIDFMSEGKTKDMKICFTDNGLPCKEYNEV